MSETIPSDEAIATWELEAKCGLGPEAAASLVEVLRRLRERHLALVERYDDRGIEVTRLVLELMAK